MTRHIPVSNMHKSRPAHWLDTIYHFSFADYWNPENVSFGPLRVLNDDLISGRSGFPTHPHNDMEIISYMVEGALTHRDSLGNEGTIRRGDVQYMSAGSGILHSEMNEGAETVRLLQIWILPDAENLAPGYGEKKLPWEARQNKLLHIVSGTGGNAPVKLNQDVNMYATELEPGGKLELPLGKGRQCYIVQIEGSARVNGILMSPRDAMEAAEENLEITAAEKSHMLFIEMGMGIA